MNPNKSHVEDEDTPPQVSLSHTHKKLSDNNVIAVLPEPTEHDGKANLRINFL